ncbi:PAS domain S-box protein [Acidisphaera sp. S103]|uniref:PAS domain S-box protein n=1 Tax=Acidisphaera sp. S103 TaxID=1747223 RepID=UPI00131B6AD0|nr:PAS domain S-box protein [Acidisphaera sp. S103]
MAPHRDANQEPSVRIAGGPPASRATRVVRRLGWRRDLSLRSRLILLVMACIVPLGCTGLVRRYLDYQDKREAVYDGLLTTAHGTAIAVERELQLRVSALETLALSPALQEGDWGQFDHLAETFLARQPLGSVLGIAGPDLRRVRVYGLPPGKSTPMLPRQSYADGIQVFDKHGPVVTDMHLGRATGRSGFSVDVPVFRDDRVVYDLYIRLLPGVIADLIARQRLPQDGSVMVVDAAGVIAARVPELDRFAGTPVSAALWDTIRSNAEGVTQVAAAKDVLTSAAYTHVMPFGWTVVVAAPNDVVFGPVREAILRVVGIGAVVLAIAMAMAMWVAKGITRPIEQLRRLAMQDGQIGPAGPSATGLPEFDMVALALTTAAAGRRDSANALAESEARFRALFEWSPGGAILLDPDTTRVIDSNAVAASYVGYSIEEFRGRAITDFALQTSHERIRAICQSVVAGHSASYETRVQGRLGPRDLLIAVAPVPVKGRTLVLINQIDVTNLRRAEAGLRVNEDRLELAREGANLGIWDWHVVNDTLTWSEHQWRLHGLEPRPGGPSPELWQQTVHRSDLRRVQEELLAALKSPGRSYMTEYSVVLSDGSLRRLLGRGQTIRGADGRAIRMVGINMDVTARYEAEMARDRLISMLETERSRLSEVIEAMPIGVGIVNADGRIVLGNAHMKRLIGPVLPSMAVAPRGEWIAYDPGGNPLPAEHFPIQRALYRGDTTLPGAEMLFRDADGSEKWFKVGSVPFRQEDGTVREALAIFLDIDAEKRLLDFQQQINVRLEQRVREEMAAREAAQQRAAHAERMHALGQIAGGIAHDFNNVLQAVSGGAALIERRPDDVERVLRNVRMVLDAARRGAAITSRLLAFSRRGDLRAESVDVAALLTDMAEVLTHTLGGSVVCKIDVPAGIPPLLADRGQLETVLVNLATNARDAMPLGGTLTLAAGSETVSPGLPHPAGLAPGYYVRIVVSDTGDGMDHAVLARVTEPFFTTKEPGKGTGLGLAMAKGFVEQSGGSLSIDSVVGRGTRISLWLPRAAGSTPFAAETIAATAAIASKPRVLLVDDDAIVREVLALSLEDAGHAVLPADSGAAALVRLAAGERVDIIVSDLTMPGMDGLALIRAAQERRPGLPAVLLTGYAGDGATLAVGGAISGTFSLLRKPVTGMQLADRINALLMSRKQINRA